MMNPAQSAFRLDNDSGLIVPAFERDERKALRARAMHLLQIVFEGKASPAELTELEKIDRDLYGYGSGWHEDKVTAPHAKALSDALLRGLADQGLIRTEDVVVRGGTGGRWVDAADFKAGR